MKSTGFSNSYLSWDVFLTGGLSIIVCLATWAFVDKGASLMTISTFAMSLAFIVNHPHFLSSYMLLYGDFRKNIFRKPRYFFSALIAPLVLGGLLIAALSKQNAALMGHIITAMYILVGWHYVKQIFGFVIVSSVQRKIYYQPFERRVLLTNLICVWMMSALASHVGDFSFSFYGIPHYGMGLPQWLQPLSYWAVGSTAVAVVWMQLQKYIREGVKPSPPGVAAFLAIYAWYLPTFSHPAFSYLIPFFHSLQYLAFVWILKKNQVQSEISHLKDAEWRATWIRKFGGFALGAVILGAMFFEFIPKALDANQLLPAGNQLGPTPFMAAFLLFINIHHYFIDNAIWRSDNEVVRKHLFNASVTPAAAPAARRTA